MAYKRKKRKKYIPIFLLLTVITILWIYNSINKKTAEEKLMKYQPEITTELNKYNLTEYTPIVLAIMDQESHGEGNDPMQSSESAGLRRNEITNPHNSIKQGIYHFYKMYQYGTKNHVDLNTIIQGYNMGPGYIKYVSNHGYKHSEELAKSYSEIQVKKFPTLYTCGHNILNFRYPYCYGDYSYSQKVNKRISRIKEILHESAIVTMAKN